LLAFAEGLPQRIGACTGTASLWGGAFEDGAVRLGAATGSCILCLLVPKASARLEHKCGHGASPRMARRVAVTSFLKAWRKGLNLRGCGGRGALTFATLCVHDVGPGVVGWCVEQLACWCVGA
ncbi:uncharacterized protein Tco025E_08389, partial [Trypanosoma conorhini]